MNLILLDDSIVDYTTVIESLNIRTKYIVLNRFADTYDTLKTKIADIGVTAFESVGILQHNTNEPTYCLFTNIVIAESVDKTQTSAEPCSSLRELAEFQLGGNDDIPTLRDPIPKSILLNVSEKDPALETWTEYINFISFLKNTYHIQNLDLMACAIYSNKDWVYVIEALQLKTGLNIRASLDNTGSQNLGGNWFLETGGINLETTYFTENINKFNGLLNVITGFTGSFAPSSWVQTTSGFTSGGSTYTVSINSGTMTLVSPDYQGDRGWAPGSVDVAVTLTSNGTISFSYSATTADSNLSYDPVGWSKNGVIDSSFNSGNNISGTRSVLLVASDKFSFFASSVDNRYGASTLTINNFTFTPYLLIPATLTVSQYIFYQKFVSGASISFDISSNAGAVSRTHASNDTAVVTIPSSGSPSASIAGPGKTTIKVTQPATTTYAQVIENALINIIVVGQGKTYTSETFPASFDLAGTNLSGSVFNSCNLTSANLFGATVNASTNFTTSTLTQITSGRITGVTSLLPAGYIMI